MTEWTKNYNTQVFDMEDKDGLKRAMTFIWMLLQDRNDLYYNDIHIREEERYLILDWTQVYFDTERESGSFQFVDYDQYVMKEIYFPDGHYEYVTSPEEEEEKRSEWQKENPEWTKNKYGTWVNEEENRRWRESVEEDRNGL